MTKPHNPLSFGSPFGQSQRPAFVMVNDQPVPTDLGGYCAWLNTKEKRKGQWIIVEPKRDDPDQTRRLDWRTEVATDDWLREKGMIPKIGRSA